MIYTTTSTTKNIRSLVGKCFLLVISMLLCGVSAWAENYSNGGTITNDVVISGNLTINAGKTLTIKSGATLTITGNLIINGTLNLEDGGEEKIGGGLVVGTWIPNADKTTNVCSSGGKITMNADAKNKTYSLLTIGSNSVLVCKDFVQNSNTYKPPLSWSYTYYAQIKMTEEALKNKSEALFVVTGTFTDDVGAESASNHPWLMCLRISFDDTKYNEVASSSATGGYTESKFGVRKGLALYVNSYKNEDNSYLSVSSHVASNGVQRNEISAARNLASTLLPITLNYFTAEQDGEDVVFEWQTASEVNNDFFTIEYSIDGVHFKELLREDGNGTTSVTNDYYATASAEEFAGITYFRLKQTDFNGEYSYSDVILLNIETETSLYVYPNPAVDVITIAGSFERISVCDAYSRTLSVQQESTNSFNVSALPVGTYYVVATTKQGKKVLPFVKR